MILRVFIDTDGREWKLLRDLECKFGTIIFQNGNNMPDDLMAMYQAGEDNLDAHALFHTGSHKAREIAGSVELDANMECGRLPSAAGT